MSHGDGASLVYTALLRLYPKEFRDEYGQDMVLLVCDQCNDEPASRVIARALLDVALSAPAQHLEAHVRRNATAVVSLLYLAIAVAGVAVAAIGGSNRSSLVLGTSMALIGGALGIVGRRRTASAARPDIGSGWWKLLLAGPLLIGVVIVASGLGVKAWYLGIATVLVAVILVAAGVVLGIARLFTRRLHTSVG